MQQLRYPNSLLYKLSRKDLRKPSWILGTMHMICAEDFLIRDKVLKALRKCSHYYMEVDLGSAVEIDIMQHGQQTSAGYFTDLTGDERDKMNLILIKEFGITVDEAAQMSPVTLLNKMATDALDCEEYKIAEMELLLIAQQLGLETGGLETADEQLRIAQDVFDGKEVLHQLQSSSDYKGLFTQMVNAYHAERLYDLARLVTDKRFMSDKAYNILVIERNKSWAKMIPPLVADKSAFIAVGAGHLPGESGLIALLKDQGYAVNPVYR